MYLANPSALIFYNGNCKYQSRTLLELPNHRAFTKSLLNQPIAAKSMVNHINNIAYYNM
jgi:hypothetical protein